MREQQRHSIRARSISTVALLAFALAFATAAFATAAVALAAATGAHASQAAHRPHAARRAAAHRHSRHRCRRGHRRGRRRRAVHVRRCIDVRFARLRSARTKTTHTTTTSSTATSSTQTTAATTSTTTTTSTTATSTTASEPASSGAETIGPISSPGVGAGWDGFGGLSLPGASWRPYASSSPFNIGAEGAAVHPDSAAIVQKVLSWGLPGNLVAGTAETSSDWSHPTYYAQPTDPLYTLHATEPWGENALDGMQIPIPEHARPAGGGDGHMTVVTPDGWEYDFWRATTPTPGGGAYDFAWGGRTRIDGDGLRSGGTAAEFGNLAGMIRAPELAAGRIDHALFIVLKCAAKGTSFGYGATGSSASSYVYPATHGGSTCPSGETDAPPLGAHFVLAMSDAQIQALPVPTWKKTILTALAHYGGYVGDTGGPGFSLMFESSSTYTALGLPDPLVQFAQENKVPTWEGKYVFNIASGVEWEKYLRVLTPPAQ